MEKNEKAGKVRSSAKRTSGSEREQVVIASVHLIILKVWTGRASPDSYYIDILLRDLLQGIGVTGIGQMNRPLIY